MASDLAIGQRIAPPRFIAFIAVALAGFAIAIRWAGWAEAAMIGFDAGALVFLLSCLGLLRREPEAMRAAVARNDANRVTLLVITGMVCGVILVAIAVELSQRGGSHAGGVALIIATLLLAWLFSNMVYALHYAHLYYSPKPKNGGDCAGIDFPSDDEPDYGDFVYFAFTLGMTFQTSDVAISSRRIRRIAILHCFAAFVFNIGVLAFTINVLGG
ncbi:DUF1345 domain-containing protein [Rhizorhabdus dicambivorans]|uniref:DUF1345 domain-containing protein n=1 Tax=Rhizorhabdus dicambivorans TaxID=1850238 RepID=A0A2A4FYP8_9SPHN|nr:DUF1345 domain-containing protein [Rhizorhabdus dicambivorans]ATE63725.1 DUF1345 domain-containing protein [Rhizorhabdus dicambivorans]PCE42855.1 DUF1345 domain-containing protein [Rhizorhabdus dicambivorans]